MKQKKDSARPLERLAERAIAWAGSTKASLFAFGLIFAWLITGPLFHWSDTWQLVINTATSISTFLMVFLIQRAQNKDSLSVALKLNELIAAIEGASNRLIDAEHLSEAELRTLERHYAKLITMAKKDSSLTQSHSIEEAEVRHTSKSGVTDR
ncbi:MAG: low affinity iron permease family protein [Candidatus Eisenbacteria bacterium]